MSHPRRVLLSDYAGHGFTFELCVGLADRPGGAAYSYCATASTPRGRLTHPRVDTYAVHAGRSFDKYRLWRRAVAELRYGIGAARVVWRTRPELHVVANMPLLSMLVIWLATLPLRARLVVWLQDVQSGLAHGLLGDGVRSRAISMLETFLLRRADRVIVISDTMIDEATRRGVDADRLGIIENWAPVESIPTTPRINRFGLEHGFADGLNFVYAGTLARKHNPAILVELARAVGPVDARVVVVSEGEGADWLLDPANTSDVENLVVLPYQPFDQLADVLGTGDVLVVLLEPLAGPFSVPSKTLSYLCAGRPILGAMPLENTASRIVVERASSGIVVPPDDIDGFCAAALDLAGDSDRRERLGSAGREYAVATFASDRVLEHFAAELEIAQHGDRPA